MRSARNQASLIATASPVMAGLIRQKKLEIVAGYYELRDGSVTMLS
jgi:carbonic anhydrase